MKVLLVHKFWKKVGGAEVYFQEVRRILTSKGHEVKVFSTMYDPGGGADIYQADDSVVMGYAPDYLKGSFIDKLSKIPETIYSRKNKEIFRDLLMDFKPDVVHVFAIYVTITPSILDVCRESGIPVVMSCNDYKHICPNYRLFHHGKVCEDCKGGRFYKAVVNNCCKHSFSVSVVSALEAYFHETINVWRRNVDMFLFESEFMLDKTREFWSDKVINTRFLGKPFDATRYTASGNYDDYALYIGRLSDEKGVDVLLQAMALTPDTKLKIAGDGSWSGYLKEQAHALGLNNVEFLGAVHGERFDRLLDNCRFVVVPSLWYENFPYVMTESFARGKAVIGSDKGGIPEYIDEGVTGYVYPAHDHVKLSECIRRLYHTDGLAAKLGMNAKRFADSEFNDDKFYARISDIYARVVRPAQHSDKSEAEQDLT
jgi:glycosyltransferase involved in cell wall biosynthesis